MDTEKFEKDMEVFSLGQHQDVLTYLTHLETNGWTIEDAKEWVEGEKEKLTQQQGKLEGITKKCPLCQSPMALLPINDSPGTKTGDDSQSMWLCSNKNCMNDIYNKESVAEVISVRKETNNKNKNIYI